MPVDQFKNKDGSPAPAGDLPRQSKAPRSSFQKPGSPYTRRARFVILGVFLWGFLCLLLVIGVLSASFTSWLWQSGTGEPARALLTGYLRWYWVLLAVFGGALVTHIGLALFQAVLLVRHLREYRRIARKVQAELAVMDGWDMLEEERKACLREEIYAEADPHIGAAALLLAGIALSALFIALFGVVFLSEDIASLPFQARAELEQIETGRLETVEVWISPKIRHTRLPGPYGSGQPALTTRYGAISADTGGEWIYIYVPSAMNFSLDPDRLYNENRVIAWNWEHAQRYRVRYTSNFHLAVEITPVT